MYPTTSRVVCTALAVAVTLASLSPVFAKPARTLGALDHALAESKRLVAAFEERLDPTPDQAATLRKKLVSLTKQRNQVAAYEKWIRDRERRLGRTEAKYRQWAKYYNDRRRTAPREAARKFLEELNAYRAVIKAEQRKIQMLRDMRPSVHDPVMRAIEQFNQIIREGLARYEAPGSRPEVR